MHRASCYNSWLVLDGPYSRVGNPVTDQEVRIIHFDGRSSLALASSGGRHSRPQQRNAGRRARAARPAASVEPPTEQEGQVEQEGEGFQAGSSSDGQEQAPPGLEGSAEPSLAAAAGGCGQANHAQQAAKQAATPAGAVSGPATGPSGRRGPSQPQVAPVPRPGAERRASNEVREDGGDQLDDCLQTQRAYQLQGLDRDTSRQAALVEARLAEAGHTGARLWRSVSFREEDERGESTVVTYSVGDAVLMPWVRRRDEREDVAAGWVLAFVELPDGLVRAVMRWCDFWEDIVAKPDDPIPIPEDEMLRGTNQVYVHELDLESAERFRYHWDAGNYAYNILRTCTILHRDEAVERYGSLERYTEQQGPDAFWYALQRTPGTLRFESAPRPGRSLQYQRLPAACLPMVDLFCGVGCVSEGFAMAGFQPVLGVDSDRSAHHAYHANFPAAASAARQRRPLTMREALADAQAHPDKYPAPGSVAHLHASPPCPALSSVNLQRNLEAVRKQVLEVIQDLTGMIRHFRPATISLEEVSGFLFARLPKSDAKGAPAAHVRPWLHLCAWLLREGYQVDWRLLLATNYGAPNTRLRLWMLAAREGFELPRPPPPHYFHDAVNEWVRIPPADELLEGAIGGDAHWLGLRVFAESHLPRAVTLREAIGDLPPLGDNAGFAPRDYPDGGNSDAAGPYAAWARQQRPSPELQYHLRTQAQPSRAAMRWDEPAPTVCARPLDRRATRHPTEPRSLTVQEKMRLQAIPDGFHLKGSLSDMYCQVGNAVPVTMAYEVAAAVHKALTGRPPAFRLPLLKAVPQAAPAAGAAAVAAADARRAAAAGQAAAQRRQQPPIEAEGGQQSGEAAPARQPQRRRGPAWRDAAVAALRRARQPQRSGPEDSEPDPASAAAGGPTGRAEAGREGRTERRSVLLRTAPPAQPPSSAGLLSPPASPLEWEVSSRMLSHSHSPHDPGRPVRKRGSPATPLGPPGVKRRRAAGEPAPGKVKPEPVPACEQQQQQQEQQQREQQQQQQQPEVVDLVSDSDDEQRPPLLADVQQELQQAEAVQRQLLFPLVGGSESSGRSPAASATLSGALDQPSTGLPAGQRCWMGAAGSISHAGGRQMAAPPGLGETIGSATAAARSLAAAQQQRQQRPPIAGGALLWPARRPGRGPILPQAERAKPLHQPASPPPPPASGAPHAAAACAGRIRHLALPLSAPAAAAQPQAGAGLYSGEFDFPQDGQSPEGQPRPPRGLTLADNRRVLAAAARGLRSS